MIAWYDSNWTARVKVSIDYSKIPSTLTNFPVGIKLGDLGSGHSFWSHVKSDGSDIRITKADGITEVPREIVAIDTTAKTGEIYFKAPSLSSSANSVFYVYYGYSSATEPSVSATYGRNNVWTSFRCVYHLNQDPSGSAPQIIDSTGNGISGTSQGSMTTSDLVAGSIGKALDFDGSNDYITVADSTDPTEYTISVFAKPANSSGSFTVRNSGNNPSSSSFSHNLRFTSTKFEHYFFDGSTVTLQANSTFTTNQWYHVCGSAKNSNSAYLYVNGTKQTATSSVSTLWTGGDTYNLFGQSAATSYFTGLIDEFRISNTQQSDAWVAAESNNLTSPSTFYALSSEETPASFSSSSWLYKLSITVDHTKLQSSLTDFPVALKLSDLGSGHSFWSHVKSDGGDIRITKADGTTEVPFELVGLDTTAKTGELHFKASGTLSSSSDTVFYLWYGNSAAGIYPFSATYGRNNVWTSDFEIVAHFNEDPDVDSFVNSVGSPSGTYTNLNGLVASSSGQLGNACDFSGGNTGYVAMSTITESDRNYAFSAFLKMSSNSSAMAAFEYSSTGSTLGGRRVAARYNSSRLNWNHNNAQGYIEPAVTINTGTWYHMSVNATQVDSTHANVNVWIDGANKTSNTNYHAIDTNGSNCVIGANRVAGEEWDGLVDELRYYKNYKSDDWMLAESANLRSPSTFVAYGSEQTADTTAPTLSSSSPTDGATAVSPTANIVLTFDETVQKGSSGNIVIKKYSDDSTFESIAITDSKITVSGTDVTINPAGTLADVTRYYITVDNTCIKDTSNNYYAGISSKDTLDFTTADTTAPTLSSSTPSDNATGVSTTANIVLNFSETVLKGSSGNIVIKKYSDDSTFESIAITDSKITVSGTDVTIDPAGTLAQGTHYYVTVDSTCIKDSSNNYYAGISSKTVLDFTTVDTTPPTLSSSTPSDNATGVGVNANIVLTFDETVQKGSTGNITIYKYADDSIFEQIAIGDSKITVSGTDVTINPAGTFDSETHYYVLVDSTCIKDTSNNYYAGISSKTVLDFTSADVIAPTLISYTPIQNAFDVDNDSNIVLTFSETVQKGSTGNIIIKKYADDTTFESIAITDSKITVSGATVTINPAGTLNYFEKYYLTIASTCIKDPSSNYYAGLTDKDTVCFTTIDLSPTLSPLDESIGNDPAAALELTFNDDVAVDAGDVRIYNRKNLFIGSSAFAGDIGEIIITKNKLADTDRQRIEGHLAFEWLGDGLDLPENHPYRYSRPTV